MSQDIKLRILETLAGGVMVTWKLGDILWDGFDALKVGPEIVPIIKRRVWSKTTRVITVNIYKEFCRQCAHAKRDRARGG